MFTITRAFMLKCPPSPRSILTKTNMEPRLIHAIARSFSSRSSSCSPTREDNRLEIDRSITLQDWQGWGTTSAIPSMVIEIVEEMKVMEVDMDDQMTFGGKGGKLQGDFKVHEDKKHRAKYKSLSDSESKLKFFSARQIACRLLGSKGYLCQKCWLPSEDCMCSKIVPSSLWQGMRFWLYMHPKDFLRQNNTGKLLWQIFGVQAATLCIYGISEHEEIMWNAFKHAGKTRVWCLYPNKNASSKSVQDIIFHGQPKDSESFHSKTNGDEPLHFILIDGTWNNSAAMFKRLKEKAELVWGEDDLPCISLTQLGTSAMHKLRPQPSWDRTCTAAAAIGLLSEMHLQSKLSSYELDKQAEALEDGLEVLLEALTSRRLRKGRSIKRRERHISQFGSGCMWR